MNGLLIAEKSQEEFGMSISIIPHFLSWTRNQVLELHQPWPLPHTNPSAERKQHSLLSQRSDGCKQLGNEFTHILRRMLFMRSFHIRQVSQVSSNWLMMDACNVFDEARLQCFFSLKIVGKLYVFQKSK